MQCWRLAVLWCALMFTAACDQGISRDESKLKTSIIGAYIARNAGTGLIKAGNNSALLQRLLELAHAHRTGTPDVIVNEAVAMNMGHVCRDYDQLQPGLLGCVERKTPPYVWKSPVELRDAAQRIGFTCDRPRDDGVACSYHGSLIQHPVRFSILPSVDGVRSAADTSFDERAYLHFKQGQLPTMDVVESSSR